MTTITLPRATVEQALEALECHADVGIKADKAITALKAALAEPEPRNQCAETCERAKLCAVCARGLAEPAQEPVTQAMRDAAVYGVGISRDGKRIDPASIYAQQAEPVLQTCNCRWNGEVQVQQCTLHEAHVDAIHEWAERAKVAERKLAQQTEPVEPVAWVYTGIKQDGTEHGPHLVWKPEYMDAMSASKGAKATPLYTSPPQRKPLTEEEIAAEWQKASECASKSEGAVTTSQFVQMFARAVERSHGIGGQE